MNSLRRKEKGDAQEGVGKSWRGMVRRYEDLRAVLFHASNQLRGLALLVGSADVKGSEPWVKEDGRRELRIREEYASCRVYRVYPVFFTALHFFYEFFAFRCSGLDSSSLRERAIKGSPSLCLALVKILRRFVYLYLWEGKGETGARISRIGIFFCT